MKHIDTLEDLTRFLGLELTSYESLPRAGHPGIRISRACAGIVRRIKDGDKEAALVGHKILVEDPHLPFGKLIKSGIARALRQRIELLSNIERAELVEKTSELLSLQFCPRETEDYCKVVRKLGANAARLVLDTAEPKNEKSRRLLAYLNQFCTSSGHPLAVPSQ